MTEHALYSSADAVPVQMPAHHWRGLPGASFARDRARMLPSFARAGTWAFRSIRQPVEGDAQAHPLYLLPGNRIHLRKDDRAGPAVESGLGRISMTDPRAVRGTGPAGRVTTFDIYTGHFGLTSRPFSLVPDPDFLFWSTAHQYAYAALEYGVLTRAPITLITGEIGAGKTVLVHQLLKTLGQGARIALVTATHGSPEELLRWVMMALGQPVSKDAAYPDLMDLFQTYLIAEYAKGNRVVLVFDEAQNLCADALEELRLLTNINSSKDELLQLVLVGQPELRTLVQRPGLTQFAQRVAASYHLTAMDAQTVRDYIAHRLLVAGGNGSLFSQAATDLIHAATGGIPRRVNQLCDLAMIYAFTAGQHSIVRFTVQQVLDDGTFFGADVVPQAAMAQTESDALVHAPQV